MSDVHELADDLAFLTKIDSKYVDVDALERILNEVSGMTVVTRLLVSTAMQRIRDGKTESETKPSLSQLLEKVTAPTNKDMLFVFNLMQAKICSDNEDRPNDWEYAADSLRIVGEILATESGEATSLAAIKDRYGRSSIQRLLDDLRQYLKIHGYEIPPTVQKYRQGSRGSIKVIKTAQE